MENVRHVHPGLLEIFMDMSDPNANMSVQGKIFTSNAALNLGQQSPVEEHI